MKIYFTTGLETREGFEAKVPSAVSSLEADSVDEIQMENVIECLDDLVSFMEDCYRVLRVGAKMTISAPHYAHARAWGSPFTKRGISEMTLNFCSKDWREQNKNANYTVTCDFEVQAHFAVEESCSQRADEVKSFWMQRYLNVAQAVIFILTKK